MNEDTHTSTSIPQPTKFILESFSVCSALLSLLGTSYIIVSYLWWKSQRLKPMMDLVFILAVTDAVNSIVWILEIIVLGRYCWIIGPIQLYGFGASLFWTCAIATDILYYLIYKYSNANGFGEAKIAFNASRPVALTVTYHIVCWLLPGLLLIDPLILDHTSGGDEFTRHFGRYENIQCWVRSPIPQIAFQVVQTCCFLYCAIVYLACKIKIKLKIKSLESQDAQTNKQMHKKLPTGFLWYLAAFLICNFILFPSYLLLQVWTNSPMWLATFCGCVAMILWPIAGFLNAIVYSTTKEEYSYILCICCNSYESRRRRRRGGGSEREMINNGDLRKTSNHEDSDASNDDIQQHLEPNFFPS